MRTKPSQRAQYTRLGRGRAPSFCLLLFGFATGCSAFPHPQWAQVDQADYVEVTSSPRPATMEIVPPRPRGDALWVDGSWEYVGERYVWKAGTWAVIPQGLRRARWLVVRRKEDGALFFAPSSWKDASGKNVDDSTWIYALGVGARARSRIDGPPVVDEPRPPPRGPRRDDEQTPPAEMR